MPRAKARKTVEQRSGDQYTGKEQQQRDDKKLLSPMVLIPLSRINRRVIHGEETHLKILFSSLQLITQHARCDPRLCEPSFQSFVITKVKFIVVAAGA